MKENIENEKNNEVILKLENVYKTYKLGSVETHALNGINLEIKQGEIIVILRAFRLW